MRLPSIHGGRWTVTIALALAAGIFGGTAVAEEAPADPAFRPPLLVAPAAPAASALQAAIDPETGMLRPPTTGERIELAALARGPVGLRRMVAASEHVHADGTISLALDPSLHSLSTVFVTADGAVHFACADAGSADHVHATPVQPVAAGEER